MTASSEAIELARVAAVAASERLAEDVIAIDVSDHVVITDVFVMCSAANDRQGAGIVDAVEEAALKIKCKPLRREGEPANRWVLLDFGDVVVHVQVAEERIHYAIERLWKDCPLIELPESVNSPRSARS